MSPGPSFEVTRRILGIDIGATNLRAGLLNPRDGINTVTRVPLPAGSEGRRAALLAAAQSFAPLDAIGVAIAGTVDAGVVTWTANLGLDGTDVGTLLAPVTTGPVVVLNDATAAGLAEARTADVGPGQLVLAITVGTGIGGALIFDRQPWLGTGQAAEIGHMTLNLDGPECGCGNRGCWEMFCGGRALDRIAARVLADPTMTAADLAAASSHDEGARRAVAAAAAAFGRGVDALCAILAPHAIVLGGGILARNGPIGRQYLAAVRDLRWAAAARIRQSDLGDDAGLLGAALSAADTVI